MCVRTVASGSAPPRRLTPTIARLIADGVVPLPRQGQPEDVGKTAAALAAGALPYMTGQPIWTAGGLNIARIL